jgi:hypothetical protein
LEKVNEKGRENIFGFTGEILPSNLKLFWSFLKPTTKSSRIPQQHSPRG